MAKKHWIAKELGLTQEHWQVILTGKGHNQSPQARCAIMEKFTQEIEDKHRSWVGEHSFGSRSDRAFKRALMYGPLDLKVLLEHHARIYASLHGKHIKSKLEN